MQNNYNQELKKLSRGQNLELMKFRFKLAELNLNFETLIEIIEKAAELEQENEFLQLILDKSFNLIPEADYGKIVINSSDSAYFLEKVERENEIYFDLENNFEANLKKDIIFKNKKSASKLVINLKTENQNYGAVILYISAASPQSFSTASNKIAALLEKIASFYLKNKQYQKLQHKLNREITVLLSNLMGIHDHYTEGHNQKVAELSKELARLLNLSDSDVKKAYLTGILHDIGKTLVPASILNKKEALTTEEYSLIKKHPLWAYKILSNSDELKDIAEFVLHHHERWDGSGYPSGLAGEEIPLISRIVSLADAWDAMCSNRVYQKALSRKEAIKQLKINKAKQFSPDLVDIFLDYIS
ncbi:MAG: HD-GYP domain-containing protein [Halanaerobium sp.]